MTEQEIRSAMAQAIGDVRKKKSYGTFDNQHSHARLRR